MFFRKLIYSFLCLGSSIAAAQTWTPLGSGTPVADIAFGEEFGTSVSIDGNVALVGTPKNSDYGFHQGKVTIFEKSGGQWTKKQDLYKGGNTSNDTSDDLFGSVVLLKGDVAFVGAPRFTYQGTFSGAVFVFKNVSGTWTFQQRIDCPFPDDFVFFGTSIAASGNHLVVGAPGAYGAVASAGAAFHFELSGGNYVYHERIHPATGTDADDFGTAVAIDANNIFVGCPQRTVLTQVAAGVVFVYNINTYAEVAQLKMSSTMFAQFGYRLALSGDDLAVAAPYTTNVNTSLGGVYLFTKPGGGWTNATENQSFFPQTQIADHGLYGGAISFLDNYLLIGGFAGTLVDLYKEGAGGWGSATLVKTFTETGLIYQNQYGAAIAMTATDILVGAFNLYQPGLGAGVVFAYGKSGAEWDTPTSLNPLRSPSMNASGDQFGSSVDINGDYAIVGAREDDSSGESSGAAYVFQFNGTSWQRVAKLKPSNGQSFNFFGSSVTITADRAVVNSPQYNMVGETSGIVYVFEKPAGGWADMTETTTIARVAATMPGAFGHDVKAIGNEVVISHFKSGGTGSYGNVYIFEKVGVNWQLKATLAPPALNDSQADGFGSRLDYDGAQLVLGLGLANDRAGLVYVYEKPAAGWTAINPTATLTPSDPMLFGGLGATVAVHDRTVIARCSGRKAAYVYERAGAHWVNTTENAKLTPQVNDPNLAVKDVALGRDNAVLSGSLNGIGLVFIFKRTNNLWMNAQSYTYFSGPAAPSELGASVGLSVDHLIASDPLSNSVGGGSTGIVKFYLKQPTVLHVTSSLPNGVYVTGQTITMNVQFTHAVTLTGSPTLELKMHDGTVRQAAIDGAVVNGSIPFKYVVVLNDSATDLNYSDELALKGTFTIKSAVISPEPALTGLPPVGSVYSLGGMKNIAIDGIVQEEPGKVTAVESNQFPVTMYPNPTRGKLNVEAKDLISCSLWDTRGVEVTQETTMESGALDVSRLIPGLYFIRIATLNGDVVLKFMKQ